MKITIYVTGNPFSLEWLEDGLVMVEGVGEFIFNRSKRQWKSTAANTELFGAYLDGKFPEGSLGSHEAMSHFVYDYVVNGCGEDPEVADEVEEYITSDFAGHIEYCKEFLAEKKHFESL